MGILRKLAFEVIRMIDAGEFNTDITDSEIELISAIIHRPLTVGREEAAGNCSTDATSAVFSTLYNLSLLSGKSGDQPYHLFLFSFFMLAP